jgi:hypothetical protein
MTSLFVQNRWVQDTTFQRRFRYTRYGFINSSMMGNLKRLSVKLSLYFVTNSCLVSLSEPVLMFPNRHIPVA